MPRKDNDGDSVISETGNWNVADQYSKSKIMRPLNLCDYYEDVASFGYDSLMEEIANHASIPNDVIRYKAIIRLVYELIRLIDNAKFALKVGNTRKDALKIKSDLVKIRESLPNLIVQNTNQVEKTRVIKIKNPSLFNTYIMNISILKSKLNEPLNKNHLIFTDKDEFDPKRFKDNIKRRIVETG